MAKATKGSSLQVLKLSPGVPTVLSGSTRFAPFWDGRILASFWRIWVNGDDIYVANRNAVNTAKASLHKSGQWTFNAGPMRLQFGAATALPGSRWNFALKLSYMIDANARPLREAAKIKPSKPVTLLLTPPGSMLVAVVLVGDVGANPAAPVPIEFPGEVILRTTMRNGKPVIVVAAVIPMPAQDLKYMLEKRQQSGKWPRPTGPDAVEMCVVHSNPNVIAIIPLREEDWTGPEVGQSDEPPRNSDTGYVTAKKGEVLMLLLAAKK
jgi:hypothetical protein